MPTLLLIYRREGPLLSVAPGCLQGRLRKAGYSVPYMCPPEVIPGKEINREATHPIWDLSPWAMSVCLSLVTPGQPKRQGPGSLSVLPRILESRRKGHWKVGKKRGGEAHQAK